MSDNKLNDQALDNVAGGMQDVRNDNSHADGDQKFNDSSNNAGGNLTDNDAQGDIIGGDKNTTDVKTEVKTDVDVDTW